MQYNNRLILTLLKLLCATLVCLSLLIVTTSSVSSNPVLVFASSGQAPLHGSKEDGFLESITREILKRIGYDLEIEIYPTARSIYNLNNGLVDGEMSRIGGLEDSYPKIIHVSEKLYDVIFYIYSKKKIDSQLGWKALENKKVAYIHGWKIIDINIPETAIVTRAKNNKQLLDLINKGRVDYFIYSGWLDESFRNELKQSGIHHHHPALDKRPVYMYLNKKHSDLIPLLKQAMQGMKKDGSYDAIVDKFLTPLSLNILTHD